VLRAARLPAPGSHFTEYILWKGLEIDFRLVLFDQMNKVLSIIRQVIGFAFEVEPLVIIYSRLDLEGDVTIPFLLAPS
jgi:hypothetical protein